MYWNVRSFISTFPISVRINSCFSLLDLCKNIGMSFWLTGKTDFVRFWVNPDATVFLLWFAKDCRIFCGREAFRNCFILYFFICLPFHFVCCCFATSSRERCLNRKQDHLANSISRFSISPPPCQRFLTISVVWEIFYYLSYLLIFSMMLLLLILFSGGAVELFIRFTSSSVVLSTKSSVPFLSSLVWSAWLF